MRGKWLIAGIAIILGFLCIRQLSYTWYTQKIEREIDVLSENQEQNQALIDTLKAETLNWGLVQYKYDDAKEKELKLGLDLKGGINVILQVQVRDLLENLTNNSQNPVFVEALNATDIAQRSQGNRAYVDIFFEEFERIRSAKNQNLPFASPDVFGTRQNASLVKFNDTDEVVKETIKGEVDAKIGTAYQVISSRIDQFGVVQPVVQRLGDEGDGRILVELPGVKDTDRVKKLLQSTAKLEFWKVESGRQDIVNFFYGLSPAKYGIADLQNLQSVMQPSGSNSTFVVQTKDTAIVNKVLNSEFLKTDMPAGIRNYKYSWANKTMQTQKNAPASNLLELYVLSGNAEGQPLLEGDAVSVARGERNAGSISNEPIVSMQMNPEGAREWGRITTELSSGQARESIAIVLDDLVYSAPGINEPILGGNSQISGNFTLNEAQDLANILQAGSLPASAKIVQADVVGPSLGQEAIDSSLMAFGIAFAMVLVWMIFFYSRAGIYSDIALVANLLFLFGLLVSWNATLTLPGIAGIILTMGMAVDANIIIYERVKEELAKGKNLKEAISIAYSWKGGFSAIIDGNVTTFLTAVVLFIFGKGPIQGFATTLMIGIFTSVFSAIFLSRIFIQNRLDNNKPVPFYTSMTKNWLQNFNFDFISKTKTFFVVSIVLTLVSLVSIFTMGFDKGIDFVGGRTYTVRFDKDVNANDVRKGLAEVFVLETGEKVSPEVKTFGSANQVKISTKYKSDDESEAVEAEIKNKLYTGLKTFLPQNMAFEDFSKEGGAAVGIVSSAKVGPTIADDITRGSFIAVSVALLVIFIYILVRFNKWQYSAGAVAALAHDAIIILGVFSLFKNFMPFSLEIDQAFIAAILTVIGYSINDTVIVFDRIREFRGDYPKMGLKDVINKAINTTLSRTFNTSTTTMLVIICIFIFGGDSIRGFMFALLIGIGFGTYSSIFVASGLMYVLSKKEKNKEIN